jgi:DNA-binding NarL/FixJ family response regulator
VGAERELTTVLLVHPDAAFHEVVSGTLGDEFRVVAAAAVARALTLFERHRPAVVVLESDLGDQRAEDVFAEMKGREAELRAVFFADADDPKRALRLAELGTVLPKRRDVERLRVALRNAVRFRALSEDVARLKDDAARAGTTTARREQEEGAGPRSKRGLTPTGVPVTAPKRSMSSADLEAVKMPDASTRIEGEGPQSRTTPTPTPEDDKRGRR